MYIITPKTVCIRGTEKCLYSRQCEIVGFPLFFRKTNKQTTKAKKKKTMAVRFHYYIYPQKNDHDFFTQFAFVDLLFFQEGKYDWFSYDQLVFL